MPGPACEAVRRTDNGPPHGTESSPFPSFYQLLPRVAPTDENENVHMDELPYLTYIYAE